MGFWDRMSRGAAQRLGRPRGHRLGFTRRQPARIRNWAIDGHCGTRRDLTRCTAPPQDQQQEHAAGQQYCGDHRNGTRAIEPQWTERRLRCRGSDAVRNHTRHEKRRGAAGNRIGGPVRAEPPDGRHVQAHGPPSPRDHRKPHRPAPSVGRRDGDGVPQLLGVRVPLQFPDPHPPTGRCRDRTLERDGVADRRTTRRRRPPVRLQHQRQHGEYHRLIRLARSAKARRSGTPYGTVVIRDTRSMPACTSLRLRSCCMRSAATRMRVRVGA